MYTSLQNFHNFFNKYVANCLMLAFTLTVLYFHWFIVEFNATICVYIDLYLRSMLLFVFILICQFQFYCQLSKHA